MSEETAGLTLDTDAAAVVTPQASDGATAGQQVEAAKTFSQADVDRLIAERLDRAKKATETATKKATEDAERKAAEEQGKFKELYDQAQARLAAAETKARELELNQQRRAAAEKVGLPGALADRLRGETPEEMEKDAAAVLAALPKPQAPNINNGGGGAGRSSGMDDAERVRLASLYGVSAKHFGVQ